MLHTSDPFGKMAAGGVFAVLAFHTFVNLAMVMQLMPVVGLWLPFMSQGGTAMWLCLASSASSWGSAGVSVRSSSKRGALGLRPSPSPRSYDFRNPHP